MLCASVVFFSGLKVDFDLEDAYRQMAEDEVRETEALEWAEAMVGDGNEDAPTDRTKTSTDTR